jgi:hypothetical protein
MPKSRISESEQTFVTRQQSGNYVLYHSLGMPESRNSGLKFGNVISQATGRGVSNIKI